MTIQKDVVFSIANFALSPEFCQYVMIEGGLETIKATASTSNNVKVFCDAARAMFCSLLTPQLRKSCFL
jgi:hypothetical protein